MSQPPTTNLPPAAPGPAEPVFGLPSPQWPWVGSRFWRRLAPGRQAIPPEVLAGVVGVCLLAAVTLLAPLGAQWPALAVAVAFVVARAAGRPLAPDDLWLSVLAVALVAVAAVRASVAVFSLCLLAALGLAGLLAVGGRSAMAVLFTPVVLVVSALRALPWTLRGLRPVRWTAAGAWVRGTVIALVVGWLCAALLASADDAFAGLLAAIAPQVDLPGLPDRVVVAALMAALTLSLAFAAAAPPRWEVLRCRRRVRPVGEWLVPLLVLDVLLAAFLGVQAAVLFGAYPEALVSGDATPAERARQGFGQLVLLTLVVAALLGWAARRSDAGHARHRRLLGAGGGTLLVLVLVVVASALRRLWLYADAFGWTVLRLNVGVFELWLGLAIALCGAAWLTHRTGLLARAVVTSAAVAVLGLGWSGPDARVASWNVDRFERTGRIDLMYARRLSDDAVPALSRLPEPQRACALAGRDIPEAPWYAPNVARLRAQAVLESLGPLARPGPAVCGEDRS